MITDTDDNQINALPFSLNEETTSDVFTIRLTDFQAGQVLTCDGSLFARVMCRLANSSDAFVDTNTSPIDLTPYVGEAVDFELKVVSLQVSGFARVVLPVRVVYPS